MSFNITSEPAKEPVTKNEVKDQLGISDNAQDLVIERRITKARLWIEDYCERSLINQTIEFRFDNFQEIIRVPRPNIVSVTSIKYIDGDGTETTIDSGEYVADTFDHVIRNAYGYTWPTPRCEKNACRIVYVAGYGTSQDDVPDAIKDELINIVGHWINYQAQQQNGQFITQVPTAIRRILDNYRTGTSFI